MSPTKEDWLPLIIALAVVGGVLALIVALLVTTPTG